MAPDPHSQDDSAPGGTYIAGHKIALSVHYNKDSKPSTAPFDGPVDTVDKTPLFHSREIAPRILQPKEETLVPNGEKITHVDDVIEMQSDLEVVRRHRELPHTLPSKVIEYLPSQQFQSTEADSLVISDISEEQYRLENRTEYLNGPDQIVPTENIKAWHPCGAVKLRLGEDEASSYIPVSVPSLLKMTRDENPNWKAMAVKREGGWKFWTYDDYYRGARIVAKAFIKLGLDRFHGVCILGFNSPEWFLSNMGAIFAGGFSAGIYTTNSAETCAHSASNCEAQLWVVEDQKQLDKVLKIKESLPHLKHIIQYRGKPTKEGVLSWDELMEIGRNESDDELENRLKRIAVNQCCTLIYTSGTTGSPKGVMLSHDNLTWTARMNCLYVGMLKGQESFVSYLPLSHIAAQITDIYCMLFGGGCAYFAQPDALKGSLVDTLKEVRPTNFLGVPRVWEKMHEKMMEIGKKTTGVKKSIAIWAKSVGLEVNRRRQRHDYTKPFAYSVAHAVVFKKVKQALGLDHCHLFLSGAAPISVDIVNYFQSLDIILTEVYGMSESTGPQNLGHERAFKVGSSGKAVPGCFLKLDNTDSEGNGEVCMGGRNVFMGYLRMEDKTLETIDKNGWLHSGDIGKLDEEGFLFITGRLKEIIITAGGENVPPVLAEDLIKAELPCISNAMLIGDRRKFLSVLLTFKTDMNADTGEPLDTLASSCIEWCKSVGSSAQHIKDILIGPDAAVMRAIQEGIDRANQKATSNAQRVQKWTIIPRDFSIPGGELGPTLKLKRPVVMKKYADTIERFYK